MRINLSTAGSIWVFNGDDRDFLGLDVSSDSFLTGQRAGTAKVFCDLTKQEALDLANALLEWVNA